MQISRRMLILMLTAAPLTSASGSKPIEARLYKTPFCGCCEGHANHLRRHGFAVKSVETHDLPLIRKRHGVPEQLEGCHTIVVGDYVVEGHVSANTIRKLLHERPDIRGISLPGMPNGSPGMTGEKNEPFTIYEIGKDGRSDRVFAVE